MVHAIFYNLPLTIMETTMTKILNHLEFLGYTIEKNEKKNTDDRQWYACAHPIHYNISCWEMRPSCVMFRMSIRTDVGFQPKTFEYFNDANRRLTITKAFADKGDEEHVLIRFEAIYTGGYEKTVFGTFMDDVQNDTQRLFKQGEHHEEVLPK